jgi:DNA integrity scanning protein DisA with diadenylate cyclase activity
VKNIIIGLPSSYEVISLWTNYLSNEGKNLARQAEKAQDAGDFTLARELYMKAAAKFKAASEISDNLPDTNMQRDQSKYYYNLAAKLEKEVGRTQIQKPEIQPETKEHKGSASELLEGTDISTEVFFTVFNLATDISREGREGRHVGTAFVVGDTAKVLDKSRQLVMNPFQGHGREKRMIIDQEAQDNVKEFAQLDGVFVITGDGVVEAAARYITLDTGSVKIQRGLGTRHQSVAAITNETRAIGIVVSQSGGVIRIFKDGKIAATLKSSG